MAWVLPILLLAWPASEIAAFIGVARWIGFAGALAGIVLSSLAGLMLLRVQGLATAQRAQAQLNRGEMPVGALFDGACLAVAGLLFLLPGFVTDAIGAVLLLPPVRRVIRVVLTRHLQGGNRPPGAGGPTVIEGDWQVVDGGDDRPGDPPDEPPRLPHARIGGTGRKRWQQRVVSPNVPC